MIWALGFILVLIALMIPLLAIVLDSPVARNFFRGTDPQALEEIMRRLQGLEDEVAELGSSLEEVRQETQFVQRLLKNPDKPDSSEQLSPPES
jgi:hypothetical protein